jgi:tRNA-splicing ligase RtcB (3'-phosphate/5'-hydroxy nucleic acid ligase)
LKDWYSAFEQSRPATWRSPEGVVFYGTERIMDAMDAEVYFQGVRTLRTSGVKAVQFSPDAHVGNGCSVGAIVVSDAKDGVILPSVVGVDIGCGVRGWTTDVAAADLPRDRLRNLLRSMQKRIGTGRGRGSGVAIEGAQLERILLAGHHAHDDLPFDPAEAPMLEEPGIPADNRWAAHAISDKAFANGLRTVGSMGGGNHFGEVQRAEVVDADRCARWGIGDQSVFVMFHSGSRGLGNIVGLEAVSRLVRHFATWKIPTQDRDLVYAPIGTDEFHQYHRQMREAINFAVANRTFMGAAVAEAFEENGLRRPRLLYDILHNTARFERLGGGKAQVLVHRKGATRALPPGHPGNPQPYRESGHPVFIPGSMGTASYILVGQPGSEASFYSVCHGAGRLMGRGQARRSIRLDDFTGALDEAGVLVNERAIGDLIDEAPQAYKDVDEVVKSVVDAGLCRVVARLWPLANMKGTD